MRDFLIVFKTLFRNSNSRTEDAEGKKKIPSGLKVLLSFLPLVALICIMVAFLAVNLKSAGEFSLLVVAIVAATQLLVTCLSMLAIVTTLYGVSFAP